ncbi:MAG: hypothetical protein M8357_11095 [Desulfobulbaceae bacterium]|nr:hypothetical protein [Desulfobulbaceae bacterium]
MIDVRLKFNALRYAKAEGYPSGSSKGFLESLKALFPGLLNIYPMMGGKGHGKQ